MMVQTEIGLLPEDWEVVRLEDQFKTFATASFSRDQMSNQGEVMCIHYGDIHTKYGNIVDANKDEIPFVSTSQAARYKLLKDGDILLADASEDDEGIGKPIAVICHDKKIIAGLHILPLRPKNDECWDVRFPSYLFSGRMVKGQVEKLSEGTKVNSITYNKIKDVLVPLPKDKSEQQNIASALSSIDKLIDDLGRTIQKKQRIREGAMEELLSGKKRLPGFTEEWVEKKIGDIGKTYSGLTGKTKEDFGHGDAKYITFLNVLNNAILDISIFEAVDVRPNEKQNAAHYGDLFFNTSSETPEDVGTCACLNTEVPNLYLNSFCFGYRLNDEEVYGNFLAYFFRTKAGRDIMYSLAQGATRYNLSKEYFNEIKITMPPTIKEQQSISYVFEAMTDEISLLESERAKYEQIRSGMMEELLTGKKRLIEK